MTIRLELIGAQAAAAQLRGVGEAAKQATRAGDAPQRFNARQTVRQAIAAGGGIGRAGNMVGGAMALGTPGVAIAAVSYGVRQLLEVENQWLAKLAEMAQQVRTYKADVLDARAGMAKDALSGMSEGDQSEHIARRDDIGKAILQARDVQAQTKAEKEKSIATDLARTVREELFRNKNPEAAIAFDKLKVQREKAEDLQLQAANESWIGKFLREAGQGLSLGVSGGSYQNQARTATDALYESAMALQKAAQSLGGNIGASP